MLEGMLTLAQQKLHAQLAKWLHCVRGLDFSLIQWVVHDLLKGRDDDHMSGIGKVLLSLHSADMPILF